MKIDPNKMAHIEKGADWSGFKPLFRNLLKYTIGLVILVPLTIGILISSCFPTILYLLWNGMCFILGIKLYPNDGFFKIVMEIITDLWRPIR